MYRCKMFEDLFELGQILTRFDIFLGVKLLMYLCY